MSTTNKVAKNPQAFRIAINSHDRENPDHPPAYGIEISTFDAERLGFEDGETLWEGCTLHTNSERPNNTFGALCDYEELRAMRAVSEHPLEV
jgi:hypothetical protein